MLTLFFLLALAGGVFRLAFDWQIKKHFGLYFSMPQALVGLLLLLAALPDFLKPIPFPVPLSILLGLLLPDLIFRRS